MATRIAGIELKDNDRLVYALTNIKGIGWSLSRKILDELKLDSSLRISDLSTDQVSSIASLLDKYTIEGDLSRKVRGDVQRLKTIGSYRGVRHNKNLPTRGQRTKSNARTNRGKRRTVGSYKKDILTKMTQDTKKSESK